GDDPPDLPATRLDQAVVRPGGGDQPSSIRAEGGEPSIPAVMPPGLHQLAGAGVPHHDFVAVLRDAGDPPAVGTDLDAHRFLVARDMGQDHSGGNINYHDVFRTVADGQDLPVPTQGREVTVGALRLGQGFRGSDFPVYGPRLAAPRLRPQVDA